MQNIYLVSFSIIITDETSQTIVRSTVGRESKHKRRRF
jgi:hypothetical protein